MYPELFNFANMSIRTINIFYVLTFLGIGYVLYRRSREEHYDEIEIFDGFILSFIFGLLGGRVGHIIINFVSFGFDAGKWINFISFPGFNFIFMLVFATIYFGLFARKRKWDVFEVLDFWTQAISLGAVFFYIGHFFNGSILGKITQLPWGIKYPQLFETRHPVQLYYAFSFVILYFYFNWLEFNYRSFRWYRGSRKTAQTGFLFFNFLIISSFLSLLFKFFAEPVLLIAGYDIEWIFYSLILILGLILMLKRSGLQNTLQKSLKKKKLK